VISAIADNLVRFIAISVVTRSDYDEASTGCE
jgi:hypothetical protein